MQLAFVKCAFISCDLLLRVVLNSVAQICQQQPSKSGAFHLVRAKQTETKLRGRRRHGHAATEAEGSARWYECSESAFVR